MYIQTYKHMYVCIYVYMANRTYISLYVQIYEETPRELLEMPETSSRALRKMARVTIQEDTKSVEVTLNVYSSSQGKTEKNQHSPRR